jgi:DNA-directed RNA polymerase specialized sigma24 family protein
MPAQAPHQGSAENGTHLAESRRHALLAVIAERHQSHLRAVARRHSANPDDAEDALQSAYAIFLAHFDQEDRYALPWLTTTLKREAWSVHHRRRRESVVDDDYSAEHLFDQIVSREPEPAERALVSEKCRDTAHLLGQLSQTSTMPLA